jgi:histidine ammonia-lyase
MAANAARHALEVVWNTERIIGIELLTAVQAVDLRLRQLGLDEKALGRRTREVYSRIRWDIPFLDVDRILHPDIERAALLVHSGEIVKATI